MFGYVRHTNAKCKNLSSWIAAEVANAIDAWDKVATILVVPSVATPNEAGKLMQLVVRDNLVFIAW